MWSQSPPPASQFREKRDILNLNAKKGEKNKEPNRVAPFSIPLVSLLLHSPYSFFLYFFPPDEFYDIFLPSPLHLSRSPSSLSLLGSFPQTGSTVF